MLIHQSVEQFLNETASKSPAPGGGSVSALAASLSAALTSMVCHLTIGKKKYADVEEEMKSTLDTSEEIRSAFQKIIDEDTRAFEAVMKAFSLPKESDEDKKKRSDAIQSATKDATVVPLELVRLCSRLAEHVETVAAKGNRNSASDAGVAALLLNAAIRGAAMNVDINLSGLKDEQFVSETRSECDGLVNSVTLKCDTMVRTIADSLKN